MKRNILITGGAGYLGSHLVNMLQGFNNVIVYDNLLYVDSYTNKHVEFVRGDIRDYDRLAHILNIGKIDTVMAVASLVGDPCCAKNPKLTQEINTDSIDWLSKNFKGKILFTSTCSCYGVHDELLDENGPTNPISKYAETKLEAEKILLTNKPDSFIVRYGTLMGCAAPFGRNRMDLCVNAMTRDAICGKPINVNAGGLQHRPLLHVSDAADILRFAMNNNLAGIFNAAYDNYTIKQIAETIAHSVPDIKIQYNDMSLQDARDYRVRCGKIFDLGWEPFESLDDTIIQLAKMIGQGRLKDPYSSVWNNALGLPEWLK